MNEKRSVHRTQWAAQFAVASELCKRNYQVAFTMGNHPEVDLMVISPEKRPFLIDVKGLYQKNYWLVKAKTARPNLYYVLAFVPDDEPNQFFILSQAEMNRAVSQDIQRGRENRLAKGLSVEKAFVMTGLHWKVAEKYRDKWERLPK